MFIYFEGGFGIQGMDHLGHPVVSWVTLRVKGWLPFDFFHRKWFFRVQETKVRPRTFSLGDIVRCRNNFPDEVLDF